MEVTKAGKIADIPMYRLEDCVDGMPFFIGEITGSCEEEVEHWGTPHRHNGFSIDILLKGTLRQAIDFKQYEVTAPAIMLMEPDQVHQHAMGDDVEIINISFTSDFLVPEMRGVISCWHCIFNSGMVPLTAEQLEELLAYARMLKQEYQSDKARKEAVLRNLLNALVIAIGRISEPSNAWLNVENSQYNMARQFKVLVDQHFHEKSQVSDYAEMLFVTPGHLNDTVKSLLGRNAKYVIDEKRMMEAKRLLYWGEHSVKQIAARLNFEDDAYFNRFFKKHTGLTPASFQKTTREKYN